MAQTASSIRDVLVSVGSVVSAATLPVPPSIITYGPLDATPIFLSQLSGQSDLPAVVISAEGSIDEETLGSGYSKWDYLVKVDYIDNPVGEKAAAGQEVHRYLEFARRVDALASAFSAAPGLTPDGLLKGGGAQVFRATVTGVRFEESASEELAGRGIRSVFVASIAMKVNTAGG